MASFDIAKFWRFCAALRVDTKDRGLISLGAADLFGCQRYFVEEIARGIDDGIHSFVVLKGRQLGITTISLALDLYWLFSHKGLSGSLVTQDEETSQMFKTTLAMYIDGLPKAAKVPVLKHNRHELVTNNRSRFAYQVAGTRKNSGLGKGKALTFLHATEVGEYGDSEGMASLRASLAESNPSRLFIYESTAQGFNPFEEMWQRAKRSTAERAIFIGWWRKESYSRGPGTAEYDVYWTGRLTAEERKWTREVKALYDYEVTPAQLAWWRWMLAEEVADEDLMMQNYPPTEDYAFIASGSNFFNTGRLSDEIKASRKEVAHHYRFVLKENFQDTDLDETNGKGANLKIWRYPEPGGQYAIGADPAFGSSDHADRFCASVWRCYSDGMEQVAEFNTADCTTYQFAWVILYLAGAYTIRSVDNPQGGNVMLNMEINGPGQSVWEEMQNLRRMASMSPKSDVSRKILSVVANLQNYLYKRLDTFGRPNAYHWMTTTNTKERMLNFFKGEFERGTSTVRSVDLLDEMRCVVRTEGSLGAPGRGKDDRVIAAGLAHVAWSDYVRMQCMQKGLMRTPAVGAPATAAAVGANGLVVQSQMVRGYLNRMGVKV